MMTKRKLMPEDTHGREALGGSSMPREISSGFFISRRKGENHMEQLLLDSTFPNVAIRQVLWSQGKEMHLSDRYRAIVDIKTNKLFSIVSSDYKLIRHEAAISDVETVLQMHRDLGKFIITTEFYNDGSRMRRTYCFPEVTVEISKGDSISLQLLLFNSYDMTWPFILLLGAFRWVCANGLVVGQKYYQFRRRHIFELADVAILDNLSDAIRRFKIIGQEWCHWSEKPLTPKIYENVIESMQLGKNGLDMIHDEASRSAKLNENGMPLVSLWIFYNLLTWYITHQSVSLNHKVEMERRLRKAIKYFR
jgi:hypothetical protein